MPNLNEFTEVPRRELSVFYVLDTSGSMAGTPIAILNSAMIETVEVLKQQARVNADAKLKIAVLEFNSGCRWVQPNGPEQIEDFCWVDLEAGGTTEIGRALRELNLKLSKKSFLKSATGAYLPIVIFMTDGCATDPKDQYDAALKEIWENKWFRHATKIGFAVGSEADHRMISEIVGTSEAVVKTSDLSLFARLIKFTSTTASMLNSTSRTSSEKVSGKDVIARAIEEGEAPENVLDLDGYPEMFTEPTDLDLDLELDWEEWEEE